LTAVTPHSSEHDEGEVEIVYNRAILLFTTDEEAVRRIHQGAAGSMILLPVDKARWPTRDYAPRAS